MYGIFKPINAGNYCISEFTAFEKRAFAIILLLLQAVQSPPLAGVSYVAHFMNIHVLNISMVISKC